MGIVAGIGVGIGVGVVVAVAVAVAVVVAVDICAVCAVGVDVAAAVAAGAVSVFGCLLLVSTDLLLLPCHYVRLNAQGVSSKDANPYVDTYREMLRDIGKVLTEQKVDWHITFGTLIGALS